MQPLDEVEDAACGHLVQVARWLVGQQQPGIVDQRAGQRHALLLAAATVRPADGRRDPPGPPPSASSPPLPALPLSHAASQQRHGHVFQGRKLRQQVMKLPNIADLPVAKGRCLAWGRLATLVEAQYTVPAEGASSAPRMCKSVLFPAPDWPRIATISPGAISKLR